MQKITFHCQTITPMFLAGADGKTPELRPPSIKGALRFWWRAMNGHLDLKTLKEREGEIFGGTDEKAGRSKVVISIHSLKNIEFIEEKLVPHKKFTAFAFKPGLQFSLDLSLTKDKIEINNKEIFNKELMKALFILTSLLGGLGKRVRRGMGSFFIKDKNIKNLEEIKNLLNIINPNKFELKENKIISKFYNAEKYPYIKNIEIGRGDSNLLYKISNSTHEVKQQNKFAYEATLGHAFRGRFASPVYISVLNPNIPIITTLNAEPDKNKHQFDISLQNQLKQNIL